MGSWKVLEKSGIFLSVKECEPCTVVRLVSPDVQTLMLRGSDRLQESHGKATAFTGLRSISPSAEYIKYSIKSLGFISDGQYMQSGLNLHAFS